ncbi:RNase adapter RapZ [Fusobacterium sp. MFO224]|uniref:RNase adapter RapZ n=1 Tax=Fusobacterium sp. MFO224 TaxID=3378070 RepID=UPI003854D8D5
MKVIIVTGLSGAGKTTALHALEDKGYFTMDNTLCRIAIFLLQNIEKGETELNIDKLALGIDNRAISSNKEFALLLQCLESIAVDYEILFLTASNETILNRYSLTRRRHPFGASTLLQSIKEERKAMTNVREKSTFILDTSDMKAKELAKMIGEIGKINKKQQISIHIRSFGFKYGIPMDTDLVYDVRMLPNPYYIEELREKTGNDKEVSDYVMKYDESKELYSKILDMVEFLLPLYIRDNKHHLTIGIGCSGGQHRSVAFVNKLSKDLSFNKIGKIYVSHREEENNHWK